MASDDNSPGYYFDEDNSWYTSVGKIIALCVLIVIVLLIYVYAWRTYRRHAREALQPSINGVSASQYSGQQPINTGLHPSVIASLPTFLYNPAHQNHNNGTIAECAVCLSNLEEGETARLIPTCKHMFHLQCINMWLSFHSTCPICRSPAQPASSTVQLQEMSIWVPTKGPQLDSYSSATPSSVGTSDDASSQTSGEDAYVISIDKSKKRIRPEEQQTDGIQR